MPLKLLAVSSDPAIIRQVQLTFEPLGCQVALSPDAAEAGARLEAEKAHGVLLHLRREADDLAFIRRLRRSRLNAASPVVLATEREDAAIMRVGFSAGANFVVSTPLGGDRLRSLYVVLRVLMMRAKIWHARLPFQTAVQCGLGQQNWEAASYNLSERGMLLAGAGPCGVGDRLQVEFPLPRHSKRIQARARVVRRDPEERLGLHFYDIASDQHQALQHYLTEQMAD